VSVPVNQIICGDNVETLRTLPDACVDSCVTDPPYGLEFMGKEWDRGVPGVELWREVLRVLKPGGHLLAFAGTRTQHRMATAIEDAGFEIRDMIAWVYGSGFPKSLDVSKAIDAQDAVQEQQARRYQFTAWVRSTGVTSKQIDQATETNMGGHYTTAASQPAIMTREHLEACRHLLGEVPEWVERECDIRSIESQTLKNREVVGQGSSAISTRKELRHDRGTVWGANSSTFDITAPATEAAQQWAGWGTALKPALEPITVARKPLGEKTVAANVLAHGTGAINVDGCRIDAEARSFSGTPNRHGGQMAGGGKRGEMRPDWTETRGRWPANLIHDGSDEVLGLFPQTASGMPGIRRNPHATNAMSGRLQLTGEIEACYNDSGSAARFFYTAKASAAERQGVTHPTVKPLDLMAYLCRLVTPPGGIVLDPFMGSGTTIKAAVSEGFQAVGIERDPAYFAMAQQRMDGAQLGLQL